jgi:thiol-disulfide isomerase/thioredoxin
MKVQKIEFADIEGEIKKTGKPVIDCLAPEIGKVYVVSITRDGCPACKKQKPKIHELARSITREYARRIEFKQIHIKHIPEHEEESLRSKDIFRHYFYPTNLILIRTGDRGAVEFYRNVSPAMSELRKNIGVAIKITLAIEKQT